MLFRSTDTNTKPIDININIDKEDKEDLLDLECIIREDNINIKLIAFDTDFDGGAEIDLKWIAGEENSHPPEYYLDQEDDSDGSEDEDEDYSVGSLLLLDMIEGQFHQ